MMDIRKDLMEIVAYYKGDYCFAKNTAIRLLKELDEAESVADQGKLPNP